MSAKSRIWARLVAAGRKTQEEMNEEVGTTNSFYGMTAAEVVRSLSYRPTKDELHQACDWLKLEYTPSMTNAQLRALIDAAAEAEALAEAGE